MKRREDLYMQYKNSFRKMQINSTRNEKSLNILTLNLHELFFKMSIICQL